MAARILFGFLFIVSLTLTFSDVALAQKPDRTVSKGRVSRVPVEVDTCGRVEHYTELERPRVRIELPVVYCDTHVVVTERYIRTEGKLFKRDIYEVVPGTEREESKLTSTFEFFDRRRESDSVLGQDAVRDIRQDCDSLRRKLILKKLEMRSQLKCN